MAFLYETHMHTSESSSCGITSGKDYIRRYLDLGYTGIIVTDHFYHGNTNVSRLLPWNEWVNRFCEGYENAWNEGEKLGLDVFFGWEENFSGDEYLIYGLDKQWLLDNPQVINWTRKEQFDTITRYGGCIVQAHPFRQREYISELHLSVDCVHGIEIANMGNRREFDALAFLYAKRLGFSMTAGSDIHGIDWLSSERALGVFVENKFDSILDYAAAVRENKIVGRRIPNGRCDITGNEKIIIPVCLHYKNGSEKLCDKESLLEWLNNYV